MAAKRILTSLFFIAASPWPCWRLAARLKAFRPNAGGRRKLRERNTSTKAKRSRQQRSAKEPKSFSVGSLILTHCRFKSRMPRSKPSPSSFRRISAAEKLGDAKGPRAVNALIAALRTETDPAAFSAIVDALSNIHDARAVDAYVDALWAPGMPDNAREHALNAIVENRSEYRLVPQIRRFYESLTDASVKARVRPILERYGN